MKPMKNVVRLGEALVQAGLIDDYQLQSALGHQRRWGGRIGKSLIDLEFMDETTLIKFLSEKMNFPAIDLSRSQISHKVFESLPQSVAEKYTVAPVLIKDTPVKKTLVLAMADPTDLRALDEIEFVTNYRIEPVVALESAIKKVLENYGREQSSAAVESISIDEPGGARMEVVQGEMDMMDEVKKAQHIDRETSPEIPEPTPAPTSDGEKIFDFDTPPLEDFEAISKTPMDDAPLEMVAEDDDDLYESAEVIEDIEPVEEIGEAEVVAEEDPYEYDIAAQPVDEDDIEEISVPAPEEVEEHSSPEPESEDSVAVVESIDQLEAIVSGAAAEDTHPETESAPDRDAVKAEEEIVEEAEEYPETAEAEPLDEEEVAEAEEITEAEEIDDDVDELEATQEMEIPPDAIDETDSEVFEASVVEDDSAEAEALEGVAPDSVTEAEMEEPVEEVAEALPEDGPEDDVETAYEAEPEVVENAVADEPEPVAEASDLADEVESLRNDMARLAEKMEGLVGLFILYGEGKLSIDQFVAELREL